MLLPGARIHAVMRGLVRLMRYNPLGILQMQHMPWGGGLFRGHQVFQKLPQFPVVCHVAAKINLPSL